MGRRGEWKKRKKECYAWKREEISSHPSFNIRFILFRVAGRINGSNSRISRWDRFSCAAQQKIAGVDGTKPEGRRSSSQFPKQGLCSTRGKLNFRTSRARRKFIYRMDRTRGSNRIFD